MPCPVYKEKDHVRRSPHTVSPKKGWQTNSSPAIEIILAQNRTHVVVRQGEFLHEKVE